MTQEIVPIPRGELGRSGIENLPAAIQRTGENASWRFIEFFPANIRNRNMRAAYALAVTRFFRWCEERGLRLEQINSTIVAAYIEQHPGSPPTVKQRLAAFRMPFYWLFVGQTIPLNPATSVRGVKHVVKRGKTPVLKADQARALLDSIDTRSILGLRDRALLGLMCYTFASGSATIHMSVEDYYQSGKRCWFRLHEKGGKRHYVPAHHNAQAYMDAYIAAAGIAEHKKKGPLYRSVDKHRRLALSSMIRTNVLRMIKRRAEDAGLPSSTCCHMFRATGITAYLENGGTIENAQAIAAHESPRTTKLYDRTSMEENKAEFGRIISDIRNLLGTGTSPPPPHLLGNGSPVLTSPNFPVKIKS